jgi:hypothetical protein
VSLASTVLSALALIAVSISLIYQAHQAKIARMIGSRERHLDLMRVMMEHPDLDYRKLDASTEATDDHLIGMSLWMGYWNTMWHIKKMDERALRFVCSELFSIGAARDWWTRVGATWSSRDSRHERKFLEIVTAECRAAGLSRQTSLDCFAEAPVLAA